MRKRELAQKISKQSGFPMTHILQIINFCFEDIIKEISVNKRIELRNFGVFTVKDLPARELYNPYTGKLEKLPARSIVDFKPGKKMKESIQPKPKRKRKPRIDHKIGFEHPRKEDLHRAISMVKGTLIQVDSEKVRGLLKIGKDIYPCTFYKKLINKLKVNEEQNFTVYPTAQILLKKGKPPVTLLKIANIRKEMENNGFTEVRGITREIKPDKFRIGVHTQFRDRPYIINIIGECPYPEGTLVKLEGYLTTRGIKMETCKEIKLEKN